MRVNVYAEEMTDRVEIIAKEIDGARFTGLRFYLALPATVDGKQYRGPFLHRPGDDDSSAVTFWGKRDLRTVLREGMALLDAHYAQRDGVAQAPPPEDRDVRTLRVTSEVVAELAAERWRQQTDEGYRHADDDLQTDAALAQAAAWYALPPSPRSGLRAGVTWPFVTRRPKPKDRRRDLVRAGALIVAEIERLDRAEQRELDGEEAARRADDPPPAPPPLSA